MKKSLLAVCLLAGMAASENLRAADDYKTCMAQARGDSDIVECNNAETARVMRRLQSRYNALVRNKYFASWNDKTLTPAQNFQLLFRQWVDYRDKYCSLYGYTFSQNQGTISKVQTSQCLLDLTNRFSKDVESVISVYNDMAVN